MNVCAFHEDEQCNSVQCEKNMSGMKVSVGVETSPQEPIPKGHEISKSGIRYPSIPNQSLEGVTSGKKLSFIGHPYRRLHTAASGGSVNISCVKMAEQAPAPAQVPAHFPPMIVQGAQNPGALGPPNPRAEKRRFIQQHLVLILHATQCRRKQLHEFCQLPHCATFRDVLTHMSSCHTDNNCQYPHCTSSKQIYRHWKACHRADCLICVPIRLADRLERNHY